MKAEKNAKDPKRNSQNRIKNRKLIDKTQKKKHHVFDRQNQTEPPKEGSTDGGFSKVLLDILITVLVAIFTYFRIVGTYTRFVFHRLRQRVFRPFYRRILLRPFKAIDNMFLSLRKALARMLRFILFKVYMFLKFFIDAKDVIKAGYHKNGSKSIGGAVSAFMRGVYNNRRIFITWLNYLMPVAGVIMLVYIIQSAASLNYAVSVEYNNVDVGYIEDESVFETAENMMQSRVTYLENDEIIDSIPKFALSVVPIDRLKDDLQLTDALMKSSGQDIVKATGIKIDGRFYGAVHDGHVIREALDELKSPFKTTEAVTVEFVNDIRLDTGFYLAQNIIEEDEIVSLLTSKEQADAYVNILEGDTPIKIASRNALSLDEFVAMNPGILDSCIVGRPVLVKKSKSYLPVSVTKTLTYTEEIPYTINKTKSDKMYSGIEETEREGQEGERQVVANVKYVDDVEISRDIVSSTVTKEPVTKEITVGTGGLPAHSGDGAVSGAGFMWPSSGGYVSSPFGKRGSSYHLGIDYATSYGTPVVASLPGVIVTAGWSGSYGNLVVIDHGAGLQTRYAHNSSIKVRVGQVVKQGDLISRVGSTGYSFGNHVHFEVRINGAARNPMNYLP